MIAERVREEIVNDHGHVAYGTDTWLSPTPGRWMVVDLHIYADHRRQGHGRDLMRQVCAHADRAGAELELWVYRSNAAALALYDSLGFVIAREVTSPAGVGSYVMVREVRS